MFSVLVFSVLFVRSQGHPTESDGELIAVNLVFRHGDRAPNNFYPNDPYQNLSLWSVPPGELTNIGKMQHFELGKWFRSRYNGFLSSTYNKDEIFVRSSNSDRCLMSVSANLAGLYPPRGKDIWNDNLSWQPIPIHTSPDTQDDIANIYSSCPTYNNLIAKAEYEVPYFKEINKKNNELYAFLSNNSGNTISNLVGANYLFDTLHVEKIYNFTLPNWALEVYPLLKEVGDIAPKLLTATSELTRLFIGRYFDDVLKQFNYLSKGTAQKAQKFRVFSGHDDQVFSILSALNVPNLQAAPYTSVAILELRKSIKAELFVQLLYKTREDVADVIKIPNCDGRCSLDEFIAITQPITLTKEEFDSECSVKNP